MNASLLLSAGLLAATTAFAASAQPAVRTTTTAPATPAAVSMDVPLIPRSVLFGNPERASVQLSPDGSLISYLAPLDGVLNVWIMPTDGGEPSPVTRSADRPIRQYGWAWNSEQVLYVQDRGGDENTNIYAVDVISGEETNLTPQEGARASILAAHRDRPDELLVLINDRDPRFQDVVRIDTRSGETERVVENTEGWVGYVPDEEWHIRGRLRMTATGGLEAQMRESDYSEWYEFLEIPMEDAGNFGLLGISADGETVFLTDPTGRDTSALVSVSPGPDGGTNRTVIFRPEGSDVADVLMNPETRRPEAVAVNRLRKQWTLLDDAVAPDFAALEGIGSGVFEVIDRSRDDRTWVVAFLEDDGPVRYWIWDRDAQEGRELFTSRPALESLPLAEMRTVEITSRDGLKLPSYYTLPVGGEDRVHPMVLLVHGGPWARDEWGYNPYHQWLANRGYAVLSVNFRGSAGFGKAFLNAGNREWYGKMQDDLVDAVRWAVDEGIADPDRVAIMGGSYGGYATLAGLTRDPGLFACGVDIVGPSHVRTLLETIPPYWEPLRVMFETRVGGLDEPEFLDSISPLMHVDRIADPLLIGQGANDPRVKLSESDQIVAAMNERSIPVTYVVFPDEGHGFAKPENNMAFNAIVEAFLARHLGGRAEPIGGDVAASSAQVRELGELSLPGVTRWQPGAAGAGAGADGGAGAAADEASSEIALEDLPESRRAEATRVVERMRQQVDDDPTAAARIAMVIGILESQASGGTEEEQLLAGYIVQELRKIVGGG
jgi:dipeptidyl aminopeptidase/acylaminoacyl peptidase